MTWNWSGHKGEGMAGTTESEPAVTMLLISWLLCIGGYYSCFLSVLLKMSPRACHLFQRTMSCVDHIQFSILDVFPAVSSCFQNLTTWRSAVRYNTMQWLLMTSSQHMGVTGWDLSPQALPSAGMPPLSHSFTLRGSCPHSPLSLSVSAIFVCFLDKVL